MQPRQRILFISYSFPPQAEVGGQRIAGLCKYLAELGAEPIVLTVQERFCESVDRTVPQPSAVRVERTEVRSTVVDVYKALQSWRSGGLRGSKAPRPQAPQRERMFWRRQALAALQIPDRDRGWYRPALRRAKELLEHESIGVVVSSGPPWTSHLIARRLKATYGVTWLADFRDPWAYSVVQEDWPPWRQWLDRRLEASCIHESDLVICNTDRLREFFVRTYAGVSPQNFVTLTNGFDDPTPEISGEKRSDGRRLVVHLGDIYGDRRIDTFCRAVTELWKQGRVDLATLRITFVGRIEPALLAAALQSLPAGPPREVVEFRPRVDWLEAQKLLKDADLLLLFPHESELQVPAKFYEYLRSGKPIFVVASDGATTDVVERTASGISADPLDAVQIAERFVRALDLHPRDPHVVQERWRGEFHYRELAQRFSELIDAAAPVLAEPVPARVPAADTGEATDPLVSVVIPAYDSAEYIGETLDSIFNQTFCDFEVLVVNDGSHDREALLHALEPYRRRIDYLEQENRGPAAARNVALRRARGRFVAFLDSDDLWTPDYLAVQVAAMRSDPTIDVLYCNAAFFGEASDVGARFMDLNPSKGEVTAEALLRLRCNVLMAALVRRRIFERVGLFDETLKGTEDFDLWLRIAKAGGRIAYHRQVLVGSRRRPDSVSANAEQMAEASLRTLDKAEQQLDLTLEERRAAADHRLRVFADRAFHRGRDAFMASDFPAAIEHLREANRFFESWKIGAVLVCLRAGPELLRRMYDWRSHLEASRMRRRSERAVARLAASRFVGAPAAAVRLQDSGLGASGAGSACRSE